MPTFPYKRQARILSYFDMSLRSVLVFGLVCAYVAFHAMHQEITVFHYLANGLNPNWRRWSTFGILLTLQVFQLCAAIGLFIATHITGERRKSQRLVILWILSTTATLLYAWIIWIENEYWILLAISVPTYAGEYFVSCKFLSKLMAQSQGQTQSRIQNSAVANSRETAM